MSTNDRPFLTRPLVIDWLQYNDFPEKLGELDYPQITLSLIEEYRTALATQSEKIRELEAKLLAFEGMTFSENSEIARLHAVLEEISQCDDNEWGKPSYEATLAHKALANPQQDNVNKQAIKFFKELLAKPDDEFFAIIDNAIPTDSDSVKDGE